MISLETVMKTIFLGFMFVVFCGMALLPFAMMWERRQSHREWIAKHRGGRDER